MASEEDDLPVANQTTASLGRMSIEELHDYITDLKNEIGRVEDLIKKKQLAENAAHSVFKT